jgi:hypothetical protein
MSNENGKKTGKVGKGNPPKETRFSSERQPEKNGRPKGVKNFKTAIEELYALPIDTLEEKIKMQILGINPRIKTLEDAFNARMLLDALCGDSYSKKEILERMHGKVSDKTELSGNVDVNLHPSILAVAKILNERKRNKE